MKMSMREMVLAFATAVIVIFGLTWWWFWQPRVESWKDTRKEIAAYRQRLQIAEHMLARQDDWNERLTEVKKFLPVYKPGEEVTANFLKLLERLANRNGLVLLRARPSDEEQVGDLYAMTFNYSWEGDLTALVKFLYAVQSEEANLDVQQLSASPTSKNPEELKGSLSIDVAYTRGEP